ncbi:MAG: hypothetical protein II766_00780 [Paludibacteraceae bacterium]|nr:hypothetical protein [Paludibacteraceae bacterium]
MKKWFAIFALSLPLSILSGSDLVLANGHASSVQNSLPVEVRYQGGKLYVDNVPANASVEVFSFVGNRIFAGRLEGNSIALNLKSGYYIVCVNGRLSKKFSVLQ